MKKPKMHVPTIRTAVEVYKDAARIERIKTGKPTKRTSGDVVRMFLYVVDCLDIKLTASVDALTRKRFNDFCVMMIEKNVSRISVLSYLDKCKALGARWTDDYYTERNFITPKFDIPKINVTPTRYKRPSIEKRKSVLKWYQSLSEEYDDVMWGVVTMMLEFGMRNSDVKLLTWGNFKRTDSGIMLEYVPHKTRLSSGRRVVAKVPNETWERLRRLKGMRKEVNDDTPVFRGLGLFGVWEELRTIMRSFGFSGSKSIYELRKLCIDTVYRNFGAEAASAISGDDIHTVTKYYADSSICDIGNVRVSELMTRGNLKCA